MAQEPQTFYYDRERKVPLEPLDDAIAVAFHEAVPPDKVDELRASDRPIARLGLSPALLSQNVLVYQPGPAATGPERLQRFSERVERAPSVRYVTPVFRDPTNGLHLVLTDEILARFKPEATQDQIDALIAGLGVEPVEQKLYAPNQYRLRVLDPAAHSALEVANAFQESGLAEWAQPNFVREKRLADLTPNQWHLNNVGQTTAGQPGVPNEDVRAKGAWALTKGSGNVVIAILDTGVDVPPPGQPGDPGHPGLRINIAEGGRSFEPGKPPNDPSPDFPEVTHVEGHGTACAGVAAGAGPEAGGPGEINGAAPACKILPIKMIQADDNGVADAIHYAAQHSQVLSNSWTSGPDAAADQAIRDVTTNGRQGKGTIVLFSAGNENQAITVGPQTAAGTILIGASTNVGSRAGYSNFGAAVDNAPNQRQLTVVAPSAGVDSLALHGFNTAGSPDNSTENIFTTDIRGTRGFNPPRAGSGINDPVANLDYSGMFSGTSSACPLVAGVCALMLSVNADLTRPQLTFFLQATAAKIGTGQARPDAPTGRVPPGQEAHYDPATGYDVNVANGRSSFGFGRVDAEQAVKVSLGAALRQISRDGAGAPVVGDNIAVVLRRQPGTTHFVSDAVIELVDARRDGVLLNQPGRVFVRGGPGGFARGLFRPEGGGSVMTAEVDVQGQVG